MIAKSILAGMAVIVSLGAGPALSRGLSRQIDDLDETVEAINATPGCEGAMKLFEACEYGTSGDIHLGAAVEKKCEGDFLSRFKASQTQAYQRQMPACDRTYQNESGTMYRSFTAFCRAEVAQRYSRQARKAAGSSSH
jgi:hypothetical protein